MGSVHWTKLRITVTVVSFYLGVFVLMTVSFFLQDVILNDKLNQPAMKIFTAIVTIIKVAQ